MRLLKKKNPKPRQYETKLFLKTLSDNGKQYDRIFLCYTV